MLYLWTGANGAGKTLLSLKECRELQLKENRPVAYNGRFKLTADFGWKVIDFKDWQKEPDGTIFFIDECHNDLPLRRAGSEVPEHVKMLAEHRRRGFDFFLITQHPNNLDVFVRRLIGSPGYHRHLKRTFGAQMVSQLTWSAVNTDCEKPASGDSGEVKMVPYPKEVYGWYESAMLHTGKKKIPKQVFVLAAIVLALPVLAWVAWSKVGQTTLTKKNGDGEPVQLAAAPARAPGALTAAEYAQSFKPRIPGLPHTAPRYDAVTAPQQAPMPVACVLKSSDPDSCTCYTQQATLLATPAELCRQIVKGGYFRDDIPASHSLQAGQVSRGEPPKVGGGTPTGYGVQPHAEPIRRVDGISVAAALRPGRGTEAVGPAAAGERSEP